jgi:arginine decarboxylase
MFTIGITKGRWNTLVTELQQFKDDYDQQSSAVEGAAGLRAHPRYERIGLKDLCTEIHRFTSQ